MIGVSIYWNCIHASSGLFDGSFIGVINYCHGTWPGGFCGILPNAVGMRPWACSTQWPSPTTRPRSRSSPGSKTRHWAPDVILGFAEYALLFPIDSGLSCSLFAI